MSLFFSIAAMFGIWSFKFVLYLVFLEELNENPTGALVPVISKSHLGTGLQKAKDRRVKERSTEPSCTGLCRM